MWKPTSTKRVVADSCPYDARLQYCRRVIVNYLKDRVPDGEIDTSLMQYYADWFLYVDGKKALLFFRAVYWILENRPSHFPPQFCYPNMFRKPLIIEVCKKN